MWNSSRFVGFLLLAALVPGCKTLSPNREPSSESLSSRFPSVLVTMLNDQELQVADLLRKDLQKSVQVVTKEYHLYHYASVDQVESKPSKVDDPVAFSLFRVKVDRYTQDRNAHGGMAGNGMYASMDPIATRDYGGSGSSGFLLLDVRMRPGIRVLNTDILNSFSDETMKGMKGVSCDLYYRNAMNSGNRKCLAIWKLVLSVLDVAAIKYSYNSALECEYERKAYVFINSKNFRPDDISLLLPTSDLNDSKTRSLIRDISWMWKNRGGGFDYYYPKEWATALVNEKAPDPQSSEWKDFLAAHIGSCPTVASHLAPVNASDWDEQNIQTNLQSGATANENFPLQASFCGRPLIHIQEVAWKDNASGTAASWQVPATLQLGRFCDGSSSCRFSVAWFHEYQQLTETAQNGQLHLKWECVACGTPEAREKDFQFTDSKFFDFDCDDSKTKRGRKKKDPKKPSDSQH